MTNKFAYLIILVVLVAATVGLPAQDSSNDECRRPPFRKGFRECCKIPKERIWGDISPNLVLCSKKVKIPTGTGLPSIPAAPEDSEILRSIIPGMNETELTGAVTSKKPISEKGKQLLEQVGEMLAFAFALYKKIMEVLRGSFSMLTDKSRGHRECLMECVFDQEGLLTKGSLNKDAILSRFKSNAGGNDDEWQKVALKSAQTCLRKNFNSPTNGVCKSKASEMFDCVSREIFMNCPDWPENDEYCNSLKEFYKRCPDAAPLPMDEKFPIIPLLPGPDALTALA